MDTKRVAGNEVVTDEGQTYCPGVVEIGKDGIVAASFPLTCEIAHTIWIGGRIEIKRNNNGLLKAYKDSNEI